MSTPHTSAVLSALSTLGEVARLPAVAVCAGLSRVETLRALKACRTAGQVGQMPRTREWVLL